MEELELEPLRCDGKARSCHDAVGGTKDLVALRSGTNVLYYDEGTGRRKMTALSVKI